MTKTIKMEKLWNTKISFFSSVKTYEHAITISLADWMVDWTVRNKNKVMHVREQYNMYLRGECDKSEYQKLKSYILPVCTPSVIIEGTRNTSNVKKYTGIICIDIDGIDDACELEKIKNKVIRLPYCFCTAKSVSGHGIYAMIAYNPNNDFKATFLSLKNKFSEMGIEIDNACSDCTRCRYISFDKNTLYKRMDTDIEVYDETEISTADTNITELETDDIRHNDNIDYLLLTKTVYFLIKNGYGQKKYDYSSWLMDGYRLASLDNQEIGFKLFLLISKNAKGYSSIDDVKKQFKACMMNNRWQNNIIYYYGLAKKIIGNEWLNEIKTMPFN